MNPKKLLMIISLAISGCAAKPVYLPVPLNLPPKPEIQKITASEVSCLSSETKNKLIQRDRMIKQYIKELESVIESTKN